MRGSLVISSLTISRRGLLDPTLIPKENSDDVVYMAVHCAMNRPAGVNKATEWPGRPSLANVSIRSKDNCTNGQWKGFVRLIAEQLMVIDPAAIEGCYTEVFPVSVATL